MESVKLDIPRKAVGGEVDELGKSLSVSKFRGAEMAIGLKIETGYGLRMEYIVKEYWKIKPCLSSWLTLYFRIEDFYIICFLFYLYFSC